ncbi:MAG: LacI family DNA-binding transcriptional regulator [Eubacteriales bacterium]|nr:LacI family DNA-binding transcriptional regulator [Eubacteriales bacterium]
MKKNQPSPSIKEIARLAGVSTATVSRVVNQTGRFSRDTQKKVQAIIAQYGYRPDAVARGLRTRSIAAAGIVVPDITDAFCAGVTLSLQQRLFTLGYAALLCNTAHSAGGEGRQVELLVAQRVGGLVYIGGQGPALSAGLPLVCIDRVPPTADGGESPVLIEADNVQGGYLATRALLGRGRRRVALMTQQNSLPGHAARRIGYQKALWELGLRAGDDLLLQVPGPSPGDAYEKLREILARGLPFDGLFCTTDYLALGALRALDERGISVPGAVSVIGFENSALCTLLPRPLTSVRLPAAEMGVLAADALCALMRAEPPEKHRFTVPVELIPRATL